MFVHCPFLIWKSLRSFYEKGIINYSLGYYGFLGELGYGPIADSLSEKITFYLRLVMSYLAKLNVIFLK